MKITIVGTGNVSWHLCRAASSVHELFVVSARNPKKTADFVSEIDCETAHSVAEIPADADIVIVCVADDAIGEVASKIAPCNAVIVHTSGATSIDVLGMHKRRGVLYPCQTFTREDHVDMQRVPFLIEASDEESLRKLREFVATISQKKVVEASSEMRAKLHVGAVIASNFTNHLLTLTSEYLQRNALDVSLLEPLVNQTITKAFAMHPRQAQTGPARRGDVRTIEKHMSLIDEENLQRVYRTMTESIINMYNK